MDIKYKYIINITPYILVILNVILKFIFISNNSIGGDEPFSIYHAQMNIPTIIQLLSEGNNPPLYEIVLHYWINLFGISEMAVRLPSLIFSVATVYFIYRIGIEFFNYRIALTAGLLFTFSNFHILFAHEARVYALFALLSTMSMFYFLKIVNTQGSLKYYVSLLFINILLLYSHYFSFYIIFIQALSIVTIKVIRVKEVKNYFLFLVFLLLLYSPYIYTVINRFIDSSQHGTWVAQPNGMISIYNMLWSFSNAPVTTVASIIVLLAALVKLFVKQDYKTISKNNQIILFWFLVPFVVMFVASYWIPMFVGRYLIFVSIGYYLLLAISSHYIVEKKWFSYIIPGILVILFLSAFNPNVDNKRHVKETITKIKELKDDHSLVLVCPKFFDLNFAYYYNLEFFKGVDNMNDYADLHEKFRAEQVYFIYSIDDVTIDTSYKVLYLDVAADNSYPNNRIVSTLEKSHILSNTYKFYEIFTVYEFVSKK